MPGLDPDLVVVAGEALTEPVATQVRVAFPAARLANIYGPTEATVYATAWYAEGPIDGPPPIGSPLDNTQVHILGPDLQPTPIGTTGEIYLAGTGLARAYHNHPTLTAPHFTANPHPPHTRKYRTRDHAQQHRSQELRQLVA